MLALFIYRLAWELSSEESRGVYGRQSFRDLERKSSVFSVLNWIKMNISKGFYNLRNWGKNSLALLLSILL